MKTGIAALILALFFGVYAFILEMKGINNSDQILLATIFGIVAAFQW